VLAELITSLITPFPRIPRRMGLLREQIAIRARERRCRAQWAGHLAASRQAMRSTHSPIPTMSPECSASGIKRSGETYSPSSVRQRNNAS